MSKFNEVFKKIYKPIQEALSKEEMEVALSKIAKTFKSFAGILPKEFVGASIQDAAPKGKRLTFNYENGTFKVPMEIKINVMPWNEESEKTGRYYIVSSGIDDDSLDSNKSRHSAALFIPQEIATVITNTKNDAMYTDKVQQHFDNLLKDNKTTRYITDGPQTAEQLQDEVEKHIESISNILDKTANGITDMVKDVRSKSDDSEDTPAPAPVKGLKRNVTDMDDDELDDEFYKRLQKKKERNF